MKGIDLNDKGQPKETIAYSQFKAYRTNFLIPGGIIEALTERRRFFRGDHYGQKYAPNAPKPTLNLCQEGVTKIAAKIVGTKRHVSFVADKDDEALESLDNFYEFQCSKMKRDLTIADAVMISLIDGSSVVFTAFDADTIGTEGLYKGFLKDKIIPFEQTFWSDPWTDDPQDMRYCGYYLDMEVGTAKELIEGDEKTKRFKEKFIAKEDSFIGESPYQFDKSTDSEITRVYVRFFFKDGECYFELSTQYVTLTERPHAINPDAVERNIVKLHEEMLKEQEKAFEEKVDKTKVKDYPTDQAKYTIQTKAQAETHEGHVKAKRKFYRYPVAVCMPYPELPHKCILGRSLVAAIIPNQKLYNYCYLLVTLIMQYHAMPKWLAKPNALGNQTIDNSPNQVLIDYSSIQEVGGNGFGLTRLNSGEAINSNLIDIGDTIAANTRFILGFANLEASGTTIDSGYEYAQRMKQINLPLEIAQNHVWDFCGELARTDLLYFIHYVDNAKFYVIRSDGELALNENYRAMEQNLIDAGKSMLPRGTRLQKSRRYEIKSINKNFFDDDFDVCIEVEQGIAGSELTESQHYNQIWQYVAQADMAADKIRMLVNGDPSFSRKTKAKLNADLESLENSQLAMKDQEIMALQQAMQELQSYLDFSNKLVKYQQQKQVAVEKAAADQAKVASQLLKSREQSEADKMSEAEVKSMNAKGISGGSFSGGSNSIYNTGA